MSPRTPLIYSADYILFLVFIDQIMYSENSKIIIRLDSFFQQMFNILEIVLDDCLVNFTKLQDFFLATFVRSYRVIDEALITETAIWPIFFISYKCFLCS